MGRFDLLRLLLLFLKKSEFGVPPVAVVSAVPATVEVALHFGGADVVTLHLIVLLECAPVVLELLQLVESLKSRKLTVILVLCNRRS